MILLELTKILNDYNQVHFFLLIIDQAEICLHQLREFFKSNRILIDINGRRTILGLSRNLIRASSRGNI